MANEHLAILVSELSKPKPDHQIVKQMCIKTGYMYSDDLIHLMSDILMSTNNLNLLRKNKKNKSQTHVGV